MFLYICLIFNESYSRVFFCESIWYPIIFLRTDVVLLKCILFLGPYFCFMCFFSMMFKFFRNKIQRIKWKELFVLYFKRKIFIFRDMF